MKYLDKENYFEKVRNRVNSLLTDVAWHGGDGSIQGEKKAKAIKRQIKKLEKIL